MSDSVKNKKNFTRCLKQFHSPKILIFFLFIINIFDSIKLVILLFIFFIFKFNMAEIQKIADTKEKHDNAARRLNIQNFNAIGQETKNFKMVSQNKMAASILNLSYVRS